MYCPFCKAEDTRVVDSRLAEDGEQVRRRRECERCSARFTTFEKPQLQMPLIVKRDGKPEPFSEDKLLSGFKRALYKRPVSPEALDHAVENIERKLRASSDRQVPSKQVGEWVMEELRDLDEIAYIRFASIYLRFKNVNEFVDTVGQLASLPSAEERRSQLPLIDAGRDPVADKPKR